jgi:uncharacterized protein YciI
MNYYALFYNVTEDYITRRAQFREEHLKLAKELNQRGELILAGALSDPYDKTLLVFKVPDKSVIEDFVKEDPYYKNGLVKSYEIRQWAVVIGN